MSRNVLSFSGYWQHHRPFLDCRAAGGAPHDACYAWTSCGQSGDVL